MKDQRYLVWRSMTRRPLRSISLILLAAILSAVVFTGTMLTGALRSGFNVMQKRLGADVMVVPYAAITKKNFDNEFLMGNVGPFYMPAENYDKICKMEGVRQAATQYYVTSLECEYCPEAVNLIGFVPETDFSILPWISGGKSSVGENECVAGCDMEVSPGDTIGLFGMDLKVAAKLDDTGTDYDQSVFVTMNTVKDLIYASEDEALISVYERNESGSVSTVLVDVEDGYDPESVMNDINIHVKKIRAMQTTQMVSGMVSSMAGASRMAALITGAVWVLSLAIMAAAFLMMTAERKKEFALIRVSGASGRKLAGMVLTEGGTLTLTGSAAGALIGLILVITCSGPVEKLLSLPFLLPGAGKMAVYAGLSLVLSTFAGLLGAGLAARRISSQETGLILRSPD